MARSYYLDLKKHFGKEFNINVASESGIEIDGFGLEKFDAVAYKKDFSFLKHGLSNCRYLRKDETVTPMSSLYCHDGILFMAREIDPDYTHHDNVLAINKLSEKNFKNCSFESIMGYMLDNNRGNHDLMIHNYSGGIELLSMSVRAPIELRNDLSTLTARTFAELHKNNIIYSDPVPTNMRYDFNNKILLNLHPYIECNSNDESEKIRDLAFFLKTNKWLPNKNKFLKEYSIAINSPNEYELINYSVNYYLQFTSDNKVDPDPGIASFWLKD